MIKLDVSQLRTELNNLYKNRDIILQESESYHKSYNIFVQYFKNIQDINKDNFLIGCHFVYGWMPTILKFNHFYFEKRSNFILSYIYSVQRSSCLIKEQEINEIILCINNSMVGTSKLLHFINPKVYAIWDSNIYHYFFPEKKYTYGIDKSNLYLEYINELKLLIENQTFNELYKEITIFFELEYEISPFRAVESLIFEIVKNKKRIQNQTQVS